VPLDAPVVLFGGLALLAYFVRGLTGAASAIVFNAAFAALLAAGLTGGLTLLDGLYWIALSDLIASFIMLFALRTQLSLEPFIRNFLAGTLPVNVLATLALPRLELGPLTAGLALVIILSGSYLALVPRVRVLEERTLRRWAVPIGMAAGVLGGLYGMAGPIAVLFVSHAGGDPSRIRARVTVLALVMGTVRTSVLILSGVYTPVRLGWNLIALPGMVLGLALGFRAHRYVRPRPFRAILGGTVALAGLAALVRTLG
jgi:uncharacterized membrane protein YfcA